MDSLKMLGLSALLAILFYFGVSAVLDTPVVYQDSITGKCVGVENQDGTGTCVNIPEKYELVYVAAK
ncbi:MAG: hypothetical protein RLZZ230_336 [Candidatus Parcubacteria bacterium]|jgi:hypothetical protein